MVECFDVTVISSGDGFSFRVPEDVMKYILDYRELTLQEHSIGSHFVTTKKMKADAPAVVEEKVLAPPAVDTKPFFQVSLYKASLQHFRSFAHMSFNFFFTYDG